MAKSAKKDNVVDIGWFQKQLKNKEITQTKMAEDIGVSRQSLRDILNGERVLRVDEIVKISETLKVPVLSVLAASTDGFNLDKEISNETETFDFAAQQVDLLEKKIKSNFDAETKFKLTKLVYKMTRKKQAEGEKFSLDMDSLEILMNNV